MGIYRNMLGVALSRPKAWAPLLGLAWAARRRGWWRRPPFLPIPPAAYLRWRMETAYGASDAAAPADETLRYLRWAARMRRGD